MEDGTVFSRRIMQLCNERGITVGKLCSMAGTTASTVHDIVSGVTANPRVFTLKKLCDALDITLADFFDCPEFNNMDEEIEWRACLIQARLFRRYINSKNPAKNKTKSKPSEAGSIWTRGAAE